VTYLNFIFIAYSGLKQPLTSVKGVK